jgi:outer membrane murein-binding lipoprotein Lpp
MPNLYELMNEYQALQDAMEAEGSSEEHLVGALLEQIDEAKGTLQSKVDSICKIVKNLSAQVATLEAEEKRLRTRRQARANNVESLRSWVRSSMSLLDVKSIHTDLFSVQLVEGPESVRILDEGSVPDEFMRVKREPNKSLILKAYKEDGEIVAGTDVVKSEQLRIS